MDYHEYMRQAAARGIEAVRKSDKWRPLMKPIYDYGVTNEVGFYRAFEAVTGEKPYSGEWWDFEWSKIWPDNQATGAQAGAVMGQICRTIAEEDATNG